VQISTQFQAKAASTAKSTNASTQRRSEML